MGHQKNPNAFPLDGNLVDKISNLNDYDPEGMTLRDYFAAKAMQALISNPNVKRPHPEDGDLEPQYNSFSAISYEYADAMLKQREQ